MHSGFWRKVLAIFMANLVCGLAIWIVSAHTHITLPINAHEPPVECHHDTSHQPLIVSPCCVMAILNAMTDSPSMPFFATLYDIPALPKKAPPGYPPYIPPKMFGV